MSQNKPIVYPIEKIVSVLSYYTCGFVGLLYLIIAIIQKKVLRQFLKYHVFMSIFLSLLIFVVSKVLIFVINILGLIFSTAQGLIIFLILAIIIVALAFAVKFAFAKNCKLKCLNCKGAKICRRKEKHSTI